MLDTQTATPTEETKVKRTAGSYILIVRNPSNALEFAEIDNANDAKKAIKNLPEGYKVENIYKGARKLQVKVQVKQTITF